MKEHSTTYCTHNDESRFIVCTWSTEELYEAVKCGYKIIEFYDGYHFCNKTDKLFTEYVNTFLKIKQEASG